MKKDKRMIYFLILILIYGSSLVYKTFQNDTFYTIKIGERIEKYGIDMKELIDKYPYEENNMRRFKK